MRKRDEQMTTERDKPASGNREHVLYKDRSDQSVYEVARDLFAAEGVPQSPYQRTSR